MLIKFSGKTVLEKGEEMMKDMLNVTIYILLTNSNIFCFEHKYMFFNNLTEVISGL